MGAKANLFAIRRKVFHGARCCRGGVALEFAFALPVLIFFIFAVFEIGRALWTQTTLEYAVEEAARFAIVNDTIRDDDTLEAAIDARLKERLTGLTTTEPTLILDIDFEVDENGDRTFVAVEGNYTFASVTSLFGLDPIELSAKTRMAFVR